MNPFDVSSQLLAAHNELLPTAEGAVFLFLFSIICLTILSVCARVQE
jgi:hypothetical protein